MLEIDLRAIQEKLRVEGRRSVRAPWLVGRVRRVLWPFMRSYHFITLEWLRDVVQMQQQRDRSVADQLSGHQHALQAATAAMTRLADRLSDRQRALQAETLAVSRQTADLRTLLQEQSTRQAALVSEMRAEMEAITQRNAELTTQLQQQATRMNEYVPRSESMPLLDRAITAFQRVEFRLSQLEGVPGDPSFKWEDDTEAAQFGSAFALGDAVCTQTAFGPMILRRGDLVSNEIIRHGAWDPHLLPFMEQGARRGTVAVDAGAHFGSLSCAMSMHFSVVHAFEPNLTNYVYLCANASLRPTGRIIPHNLGLYSEPTFISLAAPEHQEVALDVSRGLEEAFSAVENTGGLVFSPQGSGVHRARAVTLDSLALDDVGFIKVDCQGSDGHVILGSLDTLRRCRPILVFEWEEHLSAPHGLALDTVRERLNAIGYRVEVAHRHNEKQVDYVATPIE